MPLLFLSGITAHSLAPRDAFLQFQEVTHIISYVNDT